MNNFSKELSKINNVIVQLGVVLFVIGVTCTLFFGALSSVNVLPEIKLLINDIKLTVIPWFYNLSFVIVAIGVFTASKNLGEK